MLPTFPAEPIQDVSTWPTAPAIFRGARRRRIWASRRPRNGVSRWEAESRAPRPGVALRGLLATRLGVDRGQPSAIDRRSGSAGRL